jgi:sensor c-di-GMP phosphodiesterase-like protein
MTDVASSSAILRDLRERGVTLAIDDFGTGYSSLAHLNRFPVGVLKIDRSFVDGLGSDPQDSSIVAAVIALADALGLVAVAEGVERREHVAELRKLGCHLAQGYFWSCALPPQDFTHWLMLRSRSNTDPASGPPPSGRRLQLAAAR